MPGRDRARRARRRCAARASVAAGARDGLGGRRRDRAAPGCSPRRRARSTCTIGPHRRFTWVDARPRATFKAIKNALGGTVNDVVLAAVAGALGRYLRRRGAADRRARAEGDGPRVACAPTPSAARSATGRRDVGAAAGRRRGPGRAARAIVREAMEDLKESGQAVGAAGAHRAGRLRAADDHEPGRAAAGAPALLQPRRHQRARARSSRSTCSAAGCATLYPMVPLAPNQALGIAIMSYDGTLNFGLLGDYDALPDLEQLAGTCGGDRRAGRRPPAAGGPRATPRARRTATAPRRHEPRAATRARCAAQRRAALSRAGRRGRRSRAVVAAAARSSQRATSCAASRAGATARPGSCSPTRADAPHARPAPTPAYSSGPPTAARTRRAVRRPPSDDQLLTRSSRRRRAPLRQRAAPPALRALAASESRPVRPRARAPPARP